MRKIIHHLRRQPERVRTHILNVAMFIIFIVMIALWVYSLGSRIGDPDTEIKARQSLQPLSVLKDNILGGFNSITELQQ